MALSFSSDIRPLFRDNDVVAMKRFGLFDLSKYEDVVSNARPILEKLEAGTMPCDGRWSQDWVDRFSQWIAEGFPK